MGKWIVGWLVGWLVCSVPFEEEEQDGFFVFVIFSITLPLHTLYIMYAEVEMRDDAILQW